MKKYAVEAAVMAVFLIPLLFLYLKGRRRPGMNAAPGLKEGGKASRAFVILKAALVFAFFLIPVYFHSDSSYTFFNGSPASIKVAFKHTGKRVVDCDEAELIKREGERYREILKGDKGVRMDITKLAGCPRERHPVAVKLVVDGRTLLFKSYPATGLKKDMASYISEEFMLPSGEYTVKAELSDSGNPGSPDFTLSEKVSFNPYQVRLVRFDDRTGSLVIE